MPEFSTMLSLQAQMMLLLAIGIFLTKKHIITEQGRACLTDLLLFLILPANTIQSFRIEFNAEIFRSTRDILILSIVLQVFYGVICAVCYDRYAFARKAVMQYGTVCSNAGFLGSPLTEGLFGGVGLLLTSVYLIPQRIVMWSMGVSYFMQDDAAASPGGRTRYRAVLRKTLTHPCILAVFVGMALMLTQCQLPAFLGKALQCTSNCNMMPLVVLVGCRAAHVGELATGVAVVLAGMPMGGTTAILAEKYGADSAFASKCTALSTVLSLITTPLWCLVV